MSKLVGVDSYLGPEMKSTGEVMGIDTEFRPALAKALMAAGMMLPPKGAILLSIADRHKADAVTLVKDLAEQDYAIYATNGTATMIRALGIDVTTVSKAHEPGHPNTVDIVADGTVQAAVNTVTGDRTTLEDGVRDTPGGSRGAHPVLHVAGYRAGGGGEPRGGSGRVQCQAPAGVSGLIHVKPFMADGNSVNAATLAVALDKS